MNRPIRMLSFSVLLFGCPFLFVSCASTPSSCAGTLHRVEVNVSDSAVSVNPTRLAVNGGDCIEWHVNSAGATTRYEIGQIQFEEPAGSSSFTRTVERAGTIRLPTGTRAYNVVVRGRPPSRLTTAPVIVIQCFPPQCIDPEPPIRLFFTTAR